MKIEGEAVYIDAVGKRHKVEGVGNIPGVFLQKLKVSGTFTFDEVSCDDIKISGECDGKLLNAKNISIEGTSDIDTAQADSFELRGSAEIDKLVAEKILIDSRKGKIGEIKCRELKIFHREIHSSSMFSKIFGGGVSHKSNSRVKIKSVEAEEIRLENCAVDAIRCKDAFIGSNCTIEKLFVAGECKVADDSTVGETIHTASVS